MPNPIGRIFVVDDEPTIASTLVSILHMNGYSATYFTNPIEALAASRLEAPDVLISDIAMPGLSGIDLAIAMGGAFPKLKILLFSGQAGTHDLLKAARMRGFDFHLLPKPLHPTVLLARIRELVHLKPDTSLRDTG